MSSDGSHSFQHISGHGVVGLKLKRMGPRPWTSPCPKCPETAQGFDCPQGACVDKDGETVIMDGHCSVFAQTTLSAQLAGASKHVLVAAVGEEEWASATAIFRCQIISTNWARQRQCESCPVERDHGGRHLRAMARWRLRITPPQAPQRGSGISMCPGAIKPIQGFNGGLFILDFFAFCGFDLCKVEPQQR